MNRFGEWAVGVTITVGLCAGLAFGQGAPAAKKSAAEDSIPKCSEALSTVAVPTAPHGLFVILFPGARINAQTNILLHNPAICGANFYVVWKEVDRGPGSNPRYDWSRSIARSRRGSPRRSA